MKICRLLGALALLALSPAVFAATPIPLVQGQPDPSAIVGTLNQIITQVDAILSPILPPAKGGGAAMNTLSFTPGAAGGPAIIGLVPNGDTDAAIQINPAGQGDIIFFAAGGTGTLQLANLASWVPANGIGACPSVPPNNAPLGAHSSIQGFFVFDDWLAIPRYVPAC